MRAGSARILVGSIIGSVGAALLLGLSQSASASLQGGNGLIAFDSARSGNSEIYIASSDGAGPVVNVTNNLGAEDKDPAWSQDGQYLAFASDRSGEWQIYIWRSDFVEPRPVTKGSGIKGQPSWAPGSSALVFRRGGEIWVKGNAFDDVEARALMAGGGTVLGEQPKWDPSDSSLHPQEITFLSGGGLFRVTDGGAAPQPIPTTPSLVRVTSQDRRPGASGFAVTLQGPTDPAPHVDALGAAGGASTPLASAAEKGVWSPDGSRLAFVTSGGVRDLRILEPDGSVSNPDLDPSAADDAVGSFSWQPVTNRPPSPAFSFSPASPRVAAATTFTDTSTDADGGIASRAWDLDGDGQFDDGTGATITTRFPAAGSRTVGLRVTDYLGASSEVQRQVNVREPRPPTAAFNYSAAPTIAVLVGAVRVHLDGSSSFDDSQIVDYRWQLPGGVSLTGKSVDHDFAPGTYQVSLTVTDDDGQQNTVTQTVLVGQACPQLLSLSPGRAYPGQALRIRGRGFGSKPPSGWVLRVGGAAAKRAPIGTWSDRQIVVVVPPVGDVRPGGNPVTGPVSFGVPGAPECASSLQLTVLPSKPAPPTASLIAEFAGDSVRVDTSLSDGGRTGRPAERGTAREQSTFARVVTDFFQRGRRVATTRAARATVRVPSSSSPVRVVATAYSSSGSTSRAVRVLRPAAVPPPADINIPSQVVFDFGSSALRPASAEYLKRVAKVVGRASSVRVSGYTDTIGLPDYNRRLAKARAESVAAFLAVHGVKRSLMTVVGVGETRRWGRADSDLDRQRNRRVVLTVVLKTSTSRI